MWVSDENICEAEKSQCCDTLFSTNQIPLVQSTCLIGTTVALISISHVSLIICLNYWGVTLILYVTSADGLIFCGEPYNRTCLIILALFHFRPENDWKLAWSLLLLSEYSRDSAKMTRSHKISSFFFQCFLPGWWPSPWPAMTSAPETHGSSPCCRATS